MLFGQVLFREALLYGVGKEYSHLRAASANYNWSNFAYVNLPKAHFPQNGNDKYKEVDFKFNWIMVVEYICQLGNYELR